MNGFDMMLKSMLGIDPAEFKQRIEEGVILLKETLQKFDKRLSNIEAQNARIIQLLELQNGTKRHDFSNASERPGDPANVAGQSGSAGELAGPATVNGYGHGNPGSDGNGVER